MDLNFIAFLNEAKQRGIHFSFEGERLLTRAKPGDIDEDMGAAIRKNKANIISWLKKRCPLSLGLDFSKEVVSPTSLVQQQLWLHEKVANIDNIYQLPIVLRIYGECDISRIETTINYLVARHASLRSTYHFVDGELRQAVQVSVTVDVECQHRIAEKKVAEDKLAQAVDAFVFKPFELATTLPIRVGYWQLTKDEMVLAIVFHHIAVDGWSLGIIEQEFLQVYEQLSNNERPHLLEHSLNYLDYAAWQRSVVDTPEFADAKDYWQNKLAACSMTHSLPLDYRRQTDQLGKAKTHAFSLSSQLLINLNEFAHSNELTLTMVLHGALALLLAQNGSSDDVVILSPSANREFIELEGIVGHFVNLLPLRVNCEHNQLLADFFTQVKKVNFEAQTYQIVPFEQMISAIEQQGNVKSSSFSQVLLAVDYIDEAVSVAGQWHMQPYELSETPAKFELGLNAKISKNNISLAFEYRDDLFAQARIEQFAVQLEAILSQLNEPHHRLNDLLAVNAQQVTMPAHNAQQTELKVGAITEQLKRQVANSPAATAIVMANTKITYQQLDDYTNILAIRLRANQVQPNDNVGVLLTDRLATILSFIAILKVGASYVPLDTEQSLVRSHYILADTETRFVLTDFESTLANDLTTATIEYTLAPIENAAAFSLPVVDSSHRAYIMYTSGSTGQPKGVEITHGAVLALVNGKNACPLSAQTILLQTGSLAFDAATYEIWGALLNGGTLILQSGKQTSLAEINQLLERHSVNTMWLTSGLFTAWTFHLPKQVNALQHLLVGGDVIEHQGLAQFFNTFAQVNVYNGYGPTENTTFSCLQQLTPADLTLNQLPIGTAIDGCFSCVLDPSLQPVAQGAVGELYLGGTGLAKGYINQPQLTAEKFVTLTHLYDEKVRLYRTGDLVRQLDDNRMCFIGRVDEQVKIRGYRVEPGEISAVLGSLAEVNAAVITVQGTDQKKWLAAHLLVQDVLSDVQRQQLISLAKAKVEQALPSYMWPEAYGMLNQWSLTLTGKIDKAKLPALTRGNGSSDLLAVSTPWEEKLAVLWSELLDIELSAIGKNSHFFELGGHSLLAMRFVAQVEGKWSLLIKLKDMLNQPTLSDIAILVANASAVETADIIPVYPMVDQTFPPTLAQERIWFLQQMNASSGNYNIPLAFNIEGDFDIHGAKQALLTLINRHVVLRSTVISQYDKEDSSSIQFQLLPEQNHFDWLHTDLSATSTNEQPLLLAERLSFQANSAFDLLTELPLRAELIQLSQASQVLVLTFHHIAIDGWSLAVFADEFSRLYKASIADVGTSLPVQRISYADYAVWQRQQMATGQWQKQLDYWQNKLEKVPQLHSLPTDRARPEIADLRCQNHTLHLPKAVSEQLQLAASKYDISWYMLLQGLFSIALARLSQHSDIVMATPVATRESNDLQDMIGLLVNTLVLRVDCEERLSLDAFFKNLKQTHLEAVDNQDVPFEKIVELCCDNRNLSYPPLAQIIFTAETSTAKQVMTLGDAQVEEIEQTLVEGKFELSVHINQLSSGLELTLEYSTAIFDLARIKNIADCYSTLLSALSQDSTGLIGELGLTSINSLEQGIAIKADEIIAFVDAVNNQVALHSTKEAISDGQEQVSFQTLQHYVEKLSYVMAEHRQQLRNEQSQIVAVICPKSLMQSMATYGVLSAGMTYLPIDPRLPERAMRAILADAKPEIIICLTSDIHRFNELAPAANMLAIETVLSRASGNEKTVVAHTDTPAYIIYTSGTTGTPKGVMIEHHALAHHLKAITNVFQVSPADKVLQFANLSFDVAIEQSLVALVNGATSVIYDSLVEDKEPLSLAHFIRDNEITIADIPPAYLLEMSQQPDWDKPLLASSLRLVIVGGEAVPTHLVKSWFNSPLASQCKFYNAYGPTEATITAMAGEITPELSDGVPLGAAVGNRRIYVVNKALCQVEAGMQGELIIVGDSLAKGYLNQPAVSAEKFITLNQDNIEKTAYKTGDLVRLNVNKSISFIKRIDQQVKLRGYRIELEGIEAVLANHPNIRLSKVRIIEGHFARLIAYVQFKSTDLILDETLYEKWVLASLPDYMVPTQWVLIDQWPTTHNGKIDSAALPVPDKQADTEMVVLRHGKVQESLANIWANLLKIDVAVIGAEQNFFRLGGHSLSAVRLIPKIKGVFSVALGLVDIFRHPTLAEMAGQITRGEAAISPCVIPTLARSSNSRFPLSFAQYRLWFVEQFRRDFSEYNMPLAIRVKGDFDFDMAKEAVNQLITRHEILRTVYLPVSEGLGVEQKILDTFKLNGNYIDQQAHSVDQQTEFLTNYLTVETTKPFNLATDLPLRFSVIQLAPNECVAIFNFHHIACDGWSIEILEQEFSLLYTAIYHGKEPQLARLQWQYADFAVWQRNQVNEKYYQEAAHYWLEQMSSAPPFHSLTRQQLSDVSPEEHCGEVSFSLSTSQSKKLKRCANSFGLTDFMLLQGVYALAVSQFSFQEDIVIGTPFVNRVDENLHGVVGCFVNSIPLRLKCCPADSVKTFFQQIFETHVQGQKYQSLPFEKLVEVLNPVRDQNRSPIFQLFFSMDQVGNEGLAIEMPYQVELLDAELFSPVAKYELTLAMLEDNEQFTGAFIYKTSCFLPSLMAQLSDHFIALINELIECDEQVKLGVLGEQASLVKQEVAHLCTDTVIAFDKAIDVISLLQQRNDHQQSGIALQYGESTVSYPELAYQVQRVTETLMNLGLKKGDRLGLFLDRSPDFIAYALSAFSLGLVCVPLDTSLPIPRVLAILSDSGSRVVIANDKDTPMLKVSNITILAAITSEVDDNKEKLEFELNSRVQLSGEDSAYLLYTSGTTGKPKGVDVSHQALTNLIASAVEKMAIGTGKCWLWLSSVSFDISLFEWLGALYTGGTIKVLPEKIAADPFNLVQSLDEEIDFLQTTPSRMKLMLELGWRAHAQQTVLLAGEALSIELQSTLAPQCKALWNGYGPTEACIYTLFNDTKVQHTALSKVALGSGLAHYRHYICDNEQNILPSGAIGELCVAGLGLATGYWGLPEITKQKFVHKEGIERLYRTSDLVRFGDDGLVHYLGRIDNQVKVNGYRVELAEIEHCIKSLLNLAQVVVLKTKGEKLVAYLISEDLSLSSATLTTLRKNLHDVLPYYMVPNSFAVLKALPLTTNGKLDTVMLLNTDVDRNSILQQAPRTSIEKALTLLWQEFLELDVLYIDDDFFTLGGHSVIATRLITRVNSLFQSELNLRGFFQEPTLREMAVYLSALDNSELISETLLDVFQLSDQEVHAELQK